MSFEKRLFYSELSLTDYNIRCWHWCVGKYLNKSTCLCSNVKCWNLSTLPPLLNKSSSPPSTPVFDLSPETMPDSWREWRTRLWRNRTLSAHIGCWPWCHVAGGRAGFFVEVQETGKACSCLVFWPRKSVATHKKSWNKLLPAIFLQ